MSGKFEWPSGFNAEINRLVREQKEAAPVAPVVVSVEETLGNQLRRPQKYVTEVNRRTDDPMAWNYAEDEADAYMDHLEQQIDRLSAQPAPLPVGGKVSAGQHLVKRMFDECGSCKALEFIRSIESGEHDVCSPWNSPLPVVPEPLVSDEALWHMSDCDKDSMVGDVFLELQAWRKWGKENAK